MAAKVELNVVVEGWGDSLQDPGDWGVRYVVNRRAWRKAVEMPAPPCKCLTMMPAANHGDLDVECVHYDLDRGVYVVGLETMRETQAAAGITEQELRDDGWVPIPPRAVG